MTVDYKHESEMEDLRENRFTKAARQATGESQAAYERRRKQVWMDRCSILLWVFFASFALNIAQLIYILAHWNTR